jgi:hypothetical protein
VLHVDHVVLEEDRADGLDAVSGQPVEHLRGPTRELPDAGHRDRLADRYVRLRRRTLAIIFAGLST